jgi:hypothetical protein
MAKTAERLIALLDIDEVLGGKTLVMSVAA